MELSISAKSEVAQATCKCFLGQKVIWHLSLVKKWDQGSKPSASLHLGGAGEGQPLIARLSLKVKVDPMAMVICLSSQHAFSPKNDLKSVRHNSAESATVCFCFDQGGDPPANSELFIKPQLTSGEHCTGLFSVFLH